MLDLTNKKSMPLGNMLKLSFNYIFKNIFLIVLFVLTTVNLESIAPITSFIITLFLPGLITLSLADQFFDLKLNKKQYIRKLFLSAMVYAGVCAIAGFIPFVVTLSLLTLPSFIPMISVFDITFLIVLALILTLIPVIATTFAIPVFIFENVGITKAFKRSFYLTKENFFVVLGCQSFLLLSIIIGFVVTSIFENIYIVSLILTPFMVLTLVIQTIFYINTCINEMHKLENHAFRN